MTEAYYVPWLHMHQPDILVDEGKRIKIVSNIERMLSSDSGDMSWNARLMLRAYNNPAKFCNMLTNEGYEPRIMLDFSGLLLEALDRISKDNKKIDVEGEKIDDIVGEYRKALKKGCMEISGTAFSHCYFPATPMRDWGAQLKAWRDTYVRIYGREELNKVKGFWFPEMGIPGSVKELGSLIKLIKEHYEWCIMPPQAVEGFEQMSFGERIRLSCQPHLITAGKQSIPVIFRAPADFIDQQAGCDSNCVKVKVTEAAETFSESSEIPPLIVPATDGENGNVMMNEFFPKTFVPFFKNLKKNTIESITVSEFLHEFYEKGGEITPKSKVKLKLEGSSWIGSHKSWTEGTRRHEMMMKLKEISKNVRAFEGGRKEKEELKRMLLLAETSCYVYWGVDFWFDQGDSIIEMIEERLGQQDD